MIRHLLALTWNRRRTNLLLMLEIFVAFLVLVLLATWGAWGWQSWHRPLGYSVEDVWRVGVRRDDRGRPVDPSVIAERMRRLVTAARALPAVRAVALLDGPVGGIGRAIRSTIGKREYHHAAAGDEVAAVLQIEVTRGRWFGPEDDGAADHPVVITEPLAQAHFGDRDPLGQRLEDDQEPGRPLRVVGVVRDYRHRGEFRPPEEFLFHRLLPGEPTTRPPAILLALRPGTTAGFEGPLLRALHATVREWSFDVTFYDLRRQKLVQQLWNGILIIGILAFFLFLMVALGLSGAVWQNVTQRTAEIGLRRAQGASAGDIQRQLLGELAAMATLPMALGGLVVLNFATLFADLPVFDLHYVHAGSYLAGFAIAVLAIYVLVVASAYFPTRLATRIQPLEALRYE
jgi:putative ABC transport system permease protein